MSNQVTLLTIEANPAPCYGLIVHTLSTGERDVFDRHINTVQIHVGDLRVTRCRRRLCGVSEAFLFLGIAPHLNKAGRSQDALRGIHKTLLTKTTPVLAPILMRHRPTV